MTLQELRKGLHTQTAAGWQAKRRARALDKQQSSRQSVLELRRLARAFEAEEVCVLRWAQLQKNLCWCQALERALLQRRAASLLIPTASAHSDRDLSQRARTSLQKQVHLQNSL